ncbi:hypothetical protein [Vibrio sp. AND4]|uniref:hypothetical protein n=1 Tax=Vibrio sp. AND4 TaxID=314289 RepID=UPI00015F0369|nr:hypothetical protein [Vibrio sp. AND4]EDP58699.1 hypothetical protein AND4_14711 [Vibrio sp. AND4]
MNKKIICISLLSAFFTHGIYAKSSSEELTSLWEKAELEVLNDRELDKIKNNGMLTVKLNNSLTKELRDSSSILSNRDKFVNYGFNILSQEPTNYNCLMEGGTGDVPNLSKIVDGKVVNSTSEINEFFEMNTPAGEGFGKFSAFASNKRKVSQNFHELSNATTVAFTIKHQTKEKITQARPELNSRAQRLLLAGSQASKINFRNLCGDAVISSAIYGKEIAVLIQVKSKTDDLKKSKEVAKEISASYGGLVSGSASQSTIDKYRLYQNDYNFQIKAYIVGDDSVISDFNLLNFKEKLVQFEKNDSQELAPIRYETSEYLNPTNNTYWQTFLDYRPIGQKMKKWDHFMEFEYAPRCPFQPYFRLCLQTSNKYAHMYGKCGNAKRWSECFSPDQPQCTLFQGQTCNQLAKEDPIRKDMSVWKDISKPGGWSDIAYPSDKVVIPSNATKVRITFDKRRAWTPLRHGPKVGEETIIIDWDNKRSFSHQLFEISGEQLLEKGFQNYSGQMKPYIYSNFKKIEYKTEVR